MATKNFVVLSERALKNKPIGYLLHNFMNELS